MSACACTCPTYALPVYDWLRLPHHSQTDYYFFSGCASTPRSALLVYDWLRLPIIANQIGSFLFSACACTATCALPIYYW